MGNVAEWQIFLYATKVYKTVENAAKNILHRGLRELSMAI